MQKLLLWIGVLVFWGAGCASVPEKKIVVLESPPAAPAAVAAKSVVEVPPVPETPVVQRGVVFGKIDFQGELKTAYLKVMIEAKANPSEKYPLLIGDLEDPYAWPWNLKRFKPEYFFLTLPEGEYRISSVSILIGSTLVTEGLNVTFAVSPESVGYLGTLSLEGVKERSSLGTFPIIQPGFTCRVVVKNEYQEALMEFRKKHPKNTWRMMRAALMQVHPLAD